MSAVAGAAVEPATERRSLLVGTRLILAANTMLMLSMLFAYLYLRANDFGGGWRPGIPPPDMGVAAAGILVQAASIGAILAALAAVRRSARLGRLLAGIGLLLGALCIALRVFHQYHLGDGWTIQHSTYTAVSMLWLAMLTVELVLGALWLVSLLTARRRTGEVPMLVGHLRAFAETWIYLAVASIGVYLLIRLV